MNRPELSFHIAGEHGLEFVFTAGDALRYPVHTHALTYTVTLVRRGTVRLLRGGAMCLYGPGAVYVVVPHEPHSPAYSDSFALVSLCVKASLIDSMGRAAFEERLPGYMAALIAQGRLSPGDAGALRGGLDAVFRAHGRSAGRVSPDITRFLALSVPGESGLPDRLTAASGSRFHFIRKFRERLGITPHQYLMQCRIREAKRVIAEGGTLAEAAAMAGFADQSHCSRLFAARIGITPGGYRESCFRLDDN